MSRLRIVTLDYAPDLLENILSPERFEIGGAIRPDSQADAVILGFEDFHRGLSQAEQMLLRNPRLVILMIGPSLPIEWIVGAMCLGVRQVIPEGADGEIRTALDWAWTLKQGLLSAAC